ncbi:MAG TPA: tetratricopeptide repeat protein, partial [Vicinamibacterales bacterium]|nr:tetratricopeptide repeat protein [Vicinamibacterales bacterium]
MKRTERRHLKDNELERWASNVANAVEERKRELTAVVVAVLIVGGAALGYVLYRNHVQGSAHAALADAIAIQESPVGPAANPDAPESGQRFATERAKAQAVLTKYKIAADGYPSTDAGIYARYLEASTWMQLGSPGEAATSFQLVIDRDGNGLYGQMARLGLAQAQAQSNQLDAAIASYKSIIDKKDTAAPVDGVIMELGRAYLDAGKTAEAQQELNKLVQEYPDSPFSVEARQMLDALKK